MRRLNEDARNLQSEPQGPEKTLPKRGGHTKVGLLPPGHSRKAVVGVLGFLCDRKGGIDVPPDGFGAWVGVGAAWMP